MRISKGCESLDSLPKECKVKGISQENYEKLLWLASKFVGLIQSYGMHASAVMVFPTNPENWCAIEVQKKVNVVNTDFHILEEHCGLLKLDILGLKTLDVMDGAIKEIQKRENIDRSLLLYPPEEDDLTFKMLRKGWSNGCFQIESGGMMNLLTSLHPVCYNDLIPLIALYRPGPISAGMVDKMIERRNGRELVEYPHESLREVLKDTYGVMLYQEQVMNMVRVMADYTLGQADMFRRAIGRKDAKLMAEILPPFVEACEKKGYSEEDATKVAKYIEGCSDYLFSKGHSAAYGYISYQTAYLKANFPLEYMCSLLNVYGGNDSQSGYMEHCKKLGIPLYPPIMGSCGSGFTIYKDGLMVGSSSVKNVGSAKFVAVPDFKEFLNRNLNINKRVVESLVKAGSFAGNRAEMLEYLEWYKDEKVGYARKIFCEVKAQEFAEKGDSKKVKEWTKKASEISPFVFSGAEENVANWELEVLGFSFHDVLDEYDLTPCLNDRNLVGCVVEKIKPWTTKAGKDMAFLRGRSRFGVGDFVMFNSGYAEMKEGKVYLLKIWKENIVSSYITPNKRGMS